MNNNENEKNWIKLAETEKENYISFHKLAYKEDLKHAEKIALEFPRWSIISGYYAMHDITKLFLAKKFGIKITSPCIHPKVIEALKYFIKKEDLKKKIISLLEEGKRSYFDIERLKEKVVPLLLKLGKQERGKSQYYTEDYTKEKIVDSKRAVYFLDKIVKPYLDIMEELCC